MFVAHAARGTAKATLLGMAALGIAAPMGCVLSSEEGDQIIPKTFSAFIVQTQGEPQAEAGVIALVGTAGGFALLAAPLVLPPPDLFEVGDAQATIDGRLISLDVNATTVLPARPAGGVYDFTVVRNGETLRLPMQTPPDLLPLAPLDGAVVSKRGFTVSWAVGNGQLFEHGPSTDLYDFIQIDLFDGTTGIRHDVFDASRTAHTFTAADLAEFETGPVALQFTVIRNVAAGTLSGRIDVNSTIGLTLRD